ncbi:MAG: cation transporter, partial [Mycoplasma sp.]
MKNYKFQESQPLQNNYKKNENNCLIITIILNIVLLGVEFGFYFVTKSTSILFDASYSLIMTITVILMYVLNVVLEKRKFNYPLGQAIYENIFSLLKCILVIIVIGLFSFTAISTLIKVSDGTMIYEKMPSYEIYLAYVIVSCSLSAAIFFVFSFYHKRLEKKSIIISVERKACILDFGISFAVGISLLITSITSADDAMVREITDKSI